MRFPFGMLQLDGAFSRGYVYRVLVLVALIAPTQAADWPTFQHDNRRSSVTTEQLATPLKEAWHYQSAIPPQTAWTAPAKWDAYSGNKGLQSMRNFDPAFYVTAIDDSVFFGSSVTNSTHCLDASSGRERWTFVTGSAVRIPPTLDAEKGNAWFGSDDGYIYCVNSGTGELKWRHTPVTKPRWIPSNGKLISPWPVRTGVMVQDGVAYYGASLVPWDASYLVAVDANDGSPRYVREHTDMTLQGALLGSADHLYAPQGRSAPLQFAIADGNMLGALGGSGGVYCILTDDDKFIAGPGSQKEAEDVVRVSDASGRQSILSISGSNRILISGKWAYMHKGREITALNRDRYFSLQVEKNGISEQLAALEKQIKKGADKAALDQLEEGKAKVAQLTAEQERCYSWSIPSQSIPFGFMLAGDTLFIGGENTVRACDAGTGRSLWEAPVSGKAYGLAAAGGRLYVSTDRGFIYCFQP
ncbi:MAG: PQQ-binding-like beta-propeller repeat protein [Verrucomicrobiae bacterium]|nr:PQQ-binding-like beta-propeller repeat protein [Verrucomicrobiae bacterium]